LPAGIEERFAAPSAAGAGRAPLYEPQLLATASAHYVHAPAKLDAWQSLVLLAPLDEASTAAPWEAARELPDAPALAEAPEPSAQFAPLPALAARPASYARWAKQLESRLFKARTLSVFECRALRAYSNAGEALGDFRVRLRDRLRESRDLELERLRQKWAPKLRALEERLRKAQERRRREQDEYASKKLESAVSMGASVLGALFGRKLTSAANVGRAASAAKSLGRAARQRDDIARAEEGADALAAQLKALEAEFQAEVERLRAAGGVEELEIAEIQLAPRKADLSVDSLVLLWVPRPAAGA
jgi:hypothetical protein